MITPKLICQTQEKDCQVREVKIMIEMQTFRIGVVSQNKKEEKEEKETSGMQM